VGSKGMGLRTATAAAARAGLPARRLVAAASQVQARQGPRAAGARGPARARRLGWGRRLRCSRGGGARSRASPPPPRGCRGRRGAGQSRRCRRPWVGGGGVVGTRGIRWGGADARAARAGRCSGGVMFTAAARGRRGRGPSQPTAPHHARPHRCSPAASCSRAPAPGAAPAGPSAAPNTACCSASRPGRSPAYSASPPLPPEPPTAPAAPRGGGGCAPEK
jgi:hypothetical protein